MGKKYIYIDESGNTHLQDPEEEDFYTINSIILNNNNIDDKKKDVKELCKKHAGSGELKSSNIGNNRKRRETILEDISEIGLPYYCLVINKHLIYRDSGLRFPKSYYKFLHKIYYDRLKQTTAEIEIYSDRYGSSEFMESFIKYIQKHCGIFESPDFRQSSEEPLIQMADVIAGTIRRVFLKKDPPGLLNIIDNDSKPIELWPPYLPDFYEIIEELPSEKYDHQLRLLALKLAREYINNNIQNEDDETKEKVETLRYLLQAFYKNPNNYVYREEISKYLRNYDIVLSKEDISRKIISNLRDEGVLIVGTGDGLKLPNGLEDITKWVKRVNNQAVPYLKRLESARQTILRETENKLDIVKREDFTDLHSYLEGIL